LRDFENNVVTCVSVFASQDVSSGLTAFQDAASDWEFVRYCIYAPAHMFLCWC